MSIRIRTLRDAEIAGYQGKSVAHSLVSKKLNYDEVVKVFLKASERRTRKKEERAKTVYKEPLQANRYFMMLKEWELKKSQALYFDGTIAYHYECDYEENWHAYSKGWHRRYGPKKIWHRNLQLLKPGQVIETIPVKSITQAIKLVKVGKDLFRYGDVIKCITGDPMKNNLIPIKDLILYTHKYPKTKKFFDIMKQITKENKNGA